MSIRKRQKAYLCRRKNEYIDLGYENLALIVVNTVDSFFEGVFSSNLLEVPCKNAR